MPKGEFTEREKTRQHCLPGAAAIRRLTSSLVTLSSNDSVLDSCLFVSKGGEAELVDCRILSTFSSKKEKIHQLNVQSLESILAHLSPVRIPSVKVKYTTCGVPQESIIGSLLFILYINDIINISDVAKLIVFADDTNIFLCSDSLKGLQCLANHELKKFANLFKLNKLSLKIKKSNFILFHSKQKQIKIYLNVKIDNVEIDKVSKTKDPWGYTK